MVKVVHLTSVHSPFDTRIFLKECKTLAKAGYAVTLVAPHDEDVIEDGVRLRAVPRPKNRLERMTRTARNVARAALREKAKIYHVHDPELLPWLRLLRRGNEIIIFDMHENMYGSLMTKPWIRPLWRKPAAALYRKTEKWLMDHIPVIYAEESYRRSYPYLTKSETVLNMPLHEELLRLGTSDKHKEPTIGYMGRISPLRGSWTILHAMRALRDRGLAVRCECIGTGEHRHLNELKAYCARERLDNVHFHGYLPPSQGWELMARCHIGLAVLKDTMNYTESYPTKIFEYMALGLPVIASDFPFYRNIVVPRRCGLCIAPNDQESLTSAVETLIKNPLEAQAMGERGRQSVVQSFNWKNEAKKLLRFYEDLLALPQDALKWIGLE